MVNRLIKYIAIIFLLISVAKVNAQIIKITAKLDSNNILIGDQVKLKLQADVPEKTTLLWPAVNDSVSKNIEVVAKSKIDTLKPSKKGWQTFSQTLTITSFDSGSFYFPQILFLYKKIGDTANYSVLSDSVLLNVNTVKVDTTKEIKDIKGPISAPFTFEEALPYILVGLGIILLIWLSIYIYSKRRKGEIIFGKAKPVIPAYIVALEALDVLKNKKLWQNNKVKEYYTELTEIIRNYIEKRFVINALEMTSDEIIESFYTIELNSELKDKLRLMLQTADLVKFAKASPLPNEHDKSYETAKAFVENTKPIENEITDTALDTLKSELNNSDHETV